MCTVQAPQSAMPQPNFVPVSCRWRSEEHTSELQSRSDLVCRLLLEKKKRQKPGGEPNAETDLIHYQINLISFVILYCMKQLTPHGAYTQNIELIWIVTRTVSRYRC